MQQASLEPSTFFGMLAVTLLGAKLIGLLARRIGQPAVLGELVAGMILGPSALGFIDPRLEGMHLLSELGVLILLFAIGLETNLAKLLQVGGAAAAVAVVGVVLPLTLGLAACRLMGLANLPALVASAALTATSVGITARVLADLGHLQEPEGRIILGAAVIDDVLGLILLTVVFGLVNGDSVSVAGVVKVTGIAFGFLIVAILVGRWLIPHVLWLFGRIDPDAAWAVPAILLALGMAWLAAASGSAPILGAFVAGLILNGTPQEHKIEHAITQLGHLFVPVFFASVGASVDLQVINPARAENWATLGVGVVLIGVAVSTKFLAGYAPWWFRGRKAIIGLGMIPRGEVGIIFAQMGAHSKVLNARNFGAVTLMVVATTFLAPLALRALIGTGCHPGGEEEHEGIGELVTEA